MISISFGRGGGEGYRSVSYYLWWLGREVIVPPDGADEALGEAGKAFLTPTFTQAIYKIIIFK